MLDEADAEGAGHGRPVRDAQTGFGDELRLQFGLVLQEHRRLQLWLHRYEQLEEIPCQMLHLCQRCLAHRHHQKNGPGR